MPPRTWFVSSNDLAAGHGERALPHIRADWRAKISSWDAVAFALFTRINSLSGQYCPGCVYGEPEGFHIFIGQDVCQPDDADRILDVVEPARLMAGMGQLSRPVRAAFLLEGIDLTSGGRTSAAHTEADIEQTLAAFERVIARLRRWEVL